jgi:hypothetical protein
MPRKTTTEPEAAPTTTEPEAAPDTEAEAATADANGIAFVDELPDDEHKTERDSKYASAVAVLRANPGKWARITTAKNRNGARTRCYQLRKKYEATNGFEWEFRNNDVYGRYTAPDEAAAK